MNSIERVTRVLNGQRPDRPPISFWCHFGCAQTAGVAAVAAHLAHLDAFELDFLKVMNDNGYPRSAPLESIRDLPFISRLRGDESEFARQLDLLAQLRHALGSRVLMTTTVFNAWTTLRHLIESPRQHTPPDLDPQDDLTQRIVGFLRQEDHAVRSAIRNIGASLANFAARCLRAGADGIFLSVRDDWLQQPRMPADLYARLVQPSDLQILDSVARGRFNMLHVCGRPMNFRAFANYPVHAINWADRAAGPSIAAVRTWLKPAICAGLDNLTTLPDGTPEECERQAADALRQADDRPMMVVPGCTYDPERVPRQNLAAVCRAVRGGPGVARDLSRAMRPHA